HDPDAKRTTNGPGKVADLTLAEIRKLDAGGWFDPAFAGEKVPTLDEVFALLKRRNVKTILVAIDLKIDDATVEADIVRLAVKHDVLSQLICIGRTIEEPEVRRRFKTADAKAPVAMLVTTGEQLPAALADKDVDWVYVRFVPSSEQMEAIHKAGKRVFLSGKSVIGREPDNWRKAREAVVDALLTDYPLDCREVWRKKLTTDQPR